MCWFLIQELYLRNNELEHLPLDVFSNVTKLSQLSVSGTRPKAVDGNTFAHMPGKTPTVLPLLLSHFPQDVGVTFKWVRWSFKTFLVRAKEGASPRQPVAVWLWHYVLGAVDGTDQGHAVTSGHTEVLKSSAAPRKELLQAPRWKTTLASPTQEPLDEDAINTFDFRTMSILFFNFNDNVKSL